MLESNYHSGKLQSDWLTLMVPQCIISCLRTAFFNRKRLCGYTERDCFFLSLSLSIDSCDWILSRHHGKIDISSLLIWKKLFLFGKNKMAPRMAAVLRAPGKLCSFSYVLFVFLLFCVLDVVSITVYDRDTLLNIGSSVAQRKPDFEFLNAGGLFTDTASESFDWVAQSRKRHPRRKIGKRAGVLVRLRRRAFRHPLPTILLANVQSLDNKLCELRARISYQRETRDCCVICLTETWMSAMVPDSAIELTGFSVHSSDRMEELTGKSRGGGVCFYINNLWCDERNIHSIKSFCSPDLEFHTLLCRPFWLPREFTAIIITAVYIPPQANTDQAIKELYRNISEQETTHPDAAFIITGDFNKANFRTIAPKYFQHVTINTRGDRTLDHGYSPFRDAYKSLPRPPFGKSDHSSVLLLPAYRQKLKHEAPALRTIQCWSDQSDATLQDCFDHVDWDMFRAASDDDIEAYSDSVTCFIRKCTDDVVPTKTIRIYPNQKPWINSDVRSALSARTSAFKSGNKPVTISGDPSKQPNEHIKTKLKNISTTIIQEACGRALTTSQALKGINQLLWTLPPLYRTSSTPFMLGSRLITPPTQSALTRLLQKRWVHSRFLSRM